MIEIKRFSDLDNSYLRQVKDIFFLSSSKKEFKDEVIKKDFYYRWLGQYLEHCPEWSLVAIEGDQLLGYIIGHPDSKKALKEFNVPGQAAFKDLFYDYPLQLHINCHPKARGKGVGTLLMDEIYQLAREHKIRGLHIITEKGERNNRFYERNGLTFTKERDFNKSILYFMGKKVS